PASRFDRLGQSCGASRGVDCARANRGVLHMQAQESGIARWSTRGLSGENRLEFWSSALSTALIPLSVEDADSLRFESSMVGTPPGPLEVMHQVGAAHRCFRRHRELERSERRSLNLVMSHERNWEITQRGHSRMQPGDLILVDSIYPMEIVSPSDY